jgi:hypothetical protein
MKQFGTTLRLALILMVVAILAPAALSSRAAAETWEAIPPNPDVDIVYIPPTSPQWQATQQRLQQRKILEEFQRLLAPLHLPHHLRLQTQQCNQVNAFYNPSNRSLTLCYELVEAVEKDAPQTVTSDGFITRQAAIFGAIVGVLLHEGGHMMFDMLDVPRFGREEDAADATAAFLALQFSKDIARTIIKGFTYNSAQGSDPAANSPMSVWADEHGSDSQRMYNTLCLGYGGDPQSFNEFVERGWLPKERAAGCQQEYNLVKRAFDKTILPFIDPALMIRVQKAEWLTPQEMK